MNKSSLHFFFESASIMADFPIQPLPSSILTERYSPSDTHRAILTERSFRSVSHDALRKALDIMTLGSVLQANRIIELLYQYNVPNFEDDDIQTAGFHFGWAHSQQWPQCLLDPDPNKPLVGRQDTEYGNQPEALRWMEERCRSHWDEQLRSKYPAFDTEDLNQAITMLNHQDRVSMSMSGRLWRLSQAMEIALMLEERWTAEDLLRKYIPDFMAVREHYDERGHEIAAGRQVWALLGGGFFAKALHVSEEAIARYVDSVLETLTQRFHNGPQRPCKGKSIKEMVDLLDKLWLEIKPLEPDNSELVNCGEAVPATFTHKGVSEDEIAEMEERLEIQLPTDLKEFLSSTNGFYHDKRMGNNNLFTDASHMVWEKGPYGVELLCWEELSIAFIYYFEWPKLYKGIQTGSGLDEGRQLLIKPRSVKEAIMEFDRKYEKADEGTKRVLERAATDFFGGLEQLREMEWMVIVSYHWNTGSVSYG